MGSTLIAGQFSRDLRSRRTARASPDLNGATACFDATERARRPHTRRAGRIQAVLICLIEWSSGGRAGQVIVIRLVLSLSLYRPGNLR
jgi:hypothetical protein